MLKIYNSLSQKKEPFLPLHDKKVNMYVCGVTVYDYCHLGHARTYTTFDVVTRYLRWQGYDVIYVRNITDIDDKIIKRANEQGVDFKEIVNKFTQAMHEDFASLNLLPPNIEPKATEVIPEMIVMIEKLIENKAAYVAANGDVYFDVRKFKSYGCLAHRDIDQLESGARVEVNDIKRDPLDFVLWKSAKPDEPHWPSPWGIGRPGWHIECSAMAKKELGVTFDIHGGGRDLIFPHHENEIAQSEACNKHKFVNTWMHAGFLQIDQEKMSKSLGNFFTIRDVLTKHQPEVLRYFFLSSHYRSPLSFSEEALQQARSALERFYTALRDMPQAEAVKDSSYEKDFIAAMNDDFNTPVAFSVLFELAHEIQRLRSANLSVAAGLAELLRNLGGVLGVLQDNPDQFLQAGIANLNVGAEKIEELIAARNQARTDKDWAAADRIRDELISLGIILEDSSGKTTWRTSGSANG